MDELVKAALANGVKEGYQMSRFLLWVGNECFEGREVSSFMVLAARGKELAQMFLTQDRDPTIQRELQAGCKRISEGRME